MPHLFLNLQWILKLKASLPLATKLGQGNIFRSLCQEFCLQGGGCAWQGGVRGRGACVAGGACMVGGVCGRWGGMCGRGGACVAYGQ